MTYYAKLLPLALVALISACTSAGRFDDTAPTGPIAGGPQDPTSAAYFTQTVGDRVLFQVDEFMLDTPGKLVLDAQAAWLSANPNYKIVIEGHADEQGTREYNLALGARRARSVFEYLVSRGVGADRMRTVSYGKERPIEVCSVETCYSQNRRAVTALDGGQSTRTGVAAPLGVAPL